MQELLEKEKGVIPSIQREVDNRQTANIEAIIGDFKQEDVSFDIKASFKFDLNRLEEISESICKSINQKEEVFKNKVVIKLDLLNSNQKQNIVKMIEQLVELQKVNKKASLFSLLHIDIQIYEGVNENSIYLITNFVDDIHLMIDDVRKIFCDSKNKYSDSLLKFQLSLNNDFADFDQGVQSSLFFAMQCALFKLQLKMDNKCKTQLFNLLGIGQDEGLKMIFGKIRNVNMNLKYKSFKDIPNKSDFLSWIFQMQRARYTQEEVQILQSITQAISDKINFYSIFRESNTSILIQTSQQGVFQYISQTKMNI